VGPNEDYDLGYRMRSEAEPWMQHDQLRRMAGLIPVHEARLIELEVESEIARAFSFAESSPWPAKAELLADVFKEP
jgi:TPP-dependent pyruvate/acetoin dehydrogenase alpha subunit